MSYLAINTRVMNTSQQAQSSEPATPEALGDDPRRSFVQVAATAAEVIGQVGDADLRRSTPCSEFDVEALTRHVISVMHRVVALGEGAEAESVPLDAPTVKTGDWVEAWASSVADFERIWADDSLLTTDMVLPFATMPGAPTLAIYSAEILIHAWDLAKALDLDVNWDEAAAEAAYQTISFGIPAEGRGEEMPFDPVVPTADDAPAIERLVAWVGRRP